jgi:DUF1365 family protein
MTGPAAHALYEGWVQHRRYAPLTHEFRYRVCYAFLELDRLNEAFAGRLVWSHQRPALAWFRRADHLGDPRLPLADSVRHLLREHGVECAGPICLLTQLRYFGFVMNPVSFYYCYATDCRTLQAVIAEVNNTPWGEQHCYVLPWGANSSAAAWLEKQFHVSPFMPLDQQYRWRLRPPGEQLSLQIENFQQGGRQFQAMVRLRRRAWTTRELARVLWRHPLMTQRIFAGIYWQAFRLWLKGAQYYPHPGSLRNVSPTLADAEQQQKELEQCGVPS